MTIRSAVALGALFLLLMEPVPLARSAEVTLRLNLRCQIQPFKANETWRSITLVEELPANRAAIILCDVWDDHWCRSAARRCDALARKMADVVDVARTRGVRIIHAPSDCMDFYADTPQRARMLAAPNVAPPPIRECTEPSLPIDDSDGGCDDQPPCPTRRAWKRQNPAIRVAPEDGISDRGTEVFNSLRLHGVDTLLIMGVHTNMCVLKRSFAIRQMTRWGIRCILVRDLTDTMYNPRMPPFVPHDRGTDLVVEHIERYLCPSMLSDDLLAK